MPGQQLHSDMPIDHRASEPLGCMLTGLGMLQYEPLLMIISEGSTANELECTGHICHNWGAHTLQPPHKKRSSTVDAAPTHDGLAESHHSPVQGVSPPVLGIPHTQLADASRSLHSSAGQDEWACRWND